MASSVPSHSRIEHLFRPVYELNIAFFWFVGSFFTFLLSGSTFSIDDFSTSTYMVSIMFVVGSIYLLQSKPYLNRMFKLTINRKTFLKTSRLRKINRLSKRMRHKGKDKREVYIGDGFVWGAENAQRAYQVLDMDSQMSDVSIPFALKPIIKALSRETKTLGGSPWIHGMGDEVPTNIVEDTLYGHTFIAGNVGTGKTTLLRLMSINALHLGNVLIVLDPKNDKDWKNSIRSEMEYLGIGDQFYHIHPSKPSTSARMPLLKHFTRTTEVADRVAPLMGSKGGNGKPFQDFAYEIIYQTTQALKYLGRPVRLTEIQRTISADRRKLANDVFHKYFKETLGEGWQTSIAADLKKIGDADPLEAMYIYYNDKLKKHHQDAVVDGIMQFALHDTGHYNKMVVTLRPVLTTLTADPLDQLFSPIDDPTIEDDRPIVDIKSLVEKGGCLYVSLDSLTDSQSAGFISRLILAEIAAVAGKRYNDDDDEQSRRVTILNDEVHASLENNDALLNILAQGRAAKMQMILATQTVSDLEAKSDQATAKRFLGLCNNFISMRTTDPTTQEYVSTQFSKNSIAQVQMQSNSSGSTGTSMLDFSNSVGERLMKTRENTFPEELLGQLPILQYVARLADGRKLKMRLPVLINDDKPGDIAPWVQRENS